MPRNLNITDNIEMRMDSEHRANMKGRWQEEKVHFIDHFTDDTVDTAKWGVTVTNATCVIGQTTYSGGQCLYTSDTTDNESGFIASAICWEDDQNAAMECRLRITDVSGSAVYVGFSDATSESTPDMPIDYFDGTLTAVATQAAGFIIDADDSVNGASSIVGVSSKNGIAQKVDSGTDWADNAWHTLRVELDPDGDAEFYLDGARFGRLPIALLSGTKLCLIFAFANRDAAQDTVYIDRFEAWQDVDTA